MTTISYDTHLLIDGELQLGEGAVGPVLNPTTGETLVDVSDASVEQVETAVMAASHASDQWPRTTPAHHSSLLLAIADQIDARADELATLESLNCGKPFHLAKQSGRFLARSLPSPASTTCHRPLNGPTTPSTAWHPLSGPKTWTRRCKYRPAFNRDAPGSTATSCWLAKCPTVA